MRRFVITLFFGFFVLTLGQAQSFVERCEGVWEGKLMMFSNGMLMDSSSVDVKLTVMPVVNEEGNWIWKTEYQGKGNPVVKDYTIRQTASNLFLLDEGEGVIITNYVYLNKMYSSFRVGRTWLTSSYELFQNELIFEVSSGTKEKLKSKGVTNYSFAFLQRVLFRRVV